MGSETRRKGKLIQRYILNWPLLWGPVHHPVKNSQALHGICLRLKNQGTKQEKYLLIASIYLISQWWAHSFAVLVCAFMKAKWVM